ncbi:MAG: exosortase-associated EpsI family protein [Planctomycetaceae bacterium]
MKRCDALTICALVLLIAGGLIHGLASHRWIANTAVEQAVRRLSAVPRTIGDWQSEELHLSDAELTIGGIAGYIKREYTHAQTGARVTLLLVAGEPGPISLHPPTVCFSGRGFHVYGHEAGCGIPYAEGEDDARRHLLRYADFTNPADVDPSMVRVYWAWTPDGCWQSPDLPRLTFAGESSLYKMYVSELWVPEPGVREDTGTARLFLETALPEITRALTGNGVSADDSSSPMPSPGVVQSRQTSNMRLASSASSGEPSCCLTN